MGAPLLTIIIPTKNRYEYLQSSLDSIDFFYKDEPIEVIISDNSTERRAIDFPTGIKDCIKYNFIPGKLSGVENFEAAMQHATGQFITMIGDDDALGPELIRVVKWMRESGCDAVVSPFAAYMWPDIKFRSFNSSFSGTLSIDNYSGAVIKKNVRVEIHRCLQAGGTSLEALPRMYYGIIQKKVMDEVRAKTGLFFPGPSPDMANAFSAAFFTSKLCYIDFPLFIAGNSAKSAAGMGTAGKHIGEVKDNPFLPSNCSELWSELIPEFWSGPTIWAESAQKAIINCGKAELLNKFNYLKLYASCKVFHPQYNEITNQCIKTYCEQYRKNAFVAHATIVRYSVCIWYSRARNLIKNFGKAVRVKSNQSFSIQANISCVFDAARLLKEKTGAKGIMF